MALQRNKTLVYDKYGFPHLIDNPSPNGGAAPPLEPFSVPVEKLTDLGVFNAVPTNTAPLPEGDAPTNPRPRKDEHEDKEHEDLLLEQLHEWAEIEDYYDNIPWTITEPTDEEDIFDQIETQVNRMTLQARAGLKGGVYSFGGPVKSERPNNLWDNKNKGWISDTLDDQERLVTEGVVTTKGTNYMTAMTEYGKCYINLKFTRYVPEIGSSMLMLTRLKEVDKACPLMCVKVL